MKIKSSQSNSFNGTALITTNSDSIALKRDLSRSGDKKGTTYSFAFSLTEGRRLSSLLNFAKIKVKKKD